jgi:hypothetical protein
MEDFFNTNATAIFTLISSLATITLGYAFNLKSQSKKNEQELELKKVELKHKISEETYKKLFEKKIETYNTLHKMLQDHKKTILNIGREEENIDEYGRFIMVKIEEQNVYIEFIQNLAKYLESNMFYISKKVENKFTGIFLPLKSKDIDLSDMWLFGNYDHFEMEEESDKINKEFYEKYRKDINDLFELFDVEIKSIKERIDFD